MSEKARGALFSALGDIKGLAVLDAFTGSGALAFEAVSRGANHITAIDIDRSSIGAVTSSIRQLGVKSKLKAINANASGWSDNNIKARFDLVFCDPPFENLQLQLIEKLAGRHVKPNGLLVLSWPGKAGKPAFDHYEIASSNNFGDSQLIFYRRTAKP